MTTTILRRRQEAPASSGWYYARHCCELTDTIEIVKVGLNNDGEIVSWMLDANEKSDAADFEWFGSVPLCTEEKE